MTSYLSASDNNLNLNYDFANLQSGKTALTNATFGDALYKYGRRVIQLAIKFYF